MVLKVVAFLWLFGLVSSQTIPLIITTWDHGQNANNRAWEVLSETGDALYAVERGITETCELTCCTSSVGACGRVDENGEITLDALVMHGPTHSVGAVAGIKNVKNPISVARAVMDHTDLSILVGTSATDFAVQMGFVEEDLRTERTNLSHAVWQHIGCRPNQWENVVPDPATSCGPYSPADVVEAEETEAAPTDFHMPGGAFRPEELVENPDDHSDTICSIIVDSNSDIVAGASTSGRNFKIPGRIGGTPVPGSGEYVDNDVGAAVTTGNGDVMVQFSPAFLAVELMRSSGYTPTQAGQEAIARIVRYYPDFDGAIMIASKDGQFGAACNPATRTNFPFWVRTAGMETSELVIMDCAQSMMIQSNTAASVTFHWLLFVLSILFCAFK